MSANDWVKLAYGQECPICNHTDWCKIKADGTAALCGRVSIGSARTTRGGLFVHDLTDRIDVPPPQREQPKVPARNMQPIAEAAKKAISDHQLSELANRLGLQPAALRSVGVGWIEQIDGRAVQAYSFPMHNGAGDIIGISLRKPDGKKFAVRGSRNGLFVPRLRHRGPLLICEGATDTAALVQIGFDAVGRPSCNGGTDHIVHMLMMRWPVGRDSKPPVIIVADRDRPGISGARQLLREIRRTVEKATIVIPPPSIKDSRAWVQAGATCESVIDEVNRQRVYYHTVSQRRQKNGGTQPGVTQGSRGASTPTRSPQAEGSARTTKIQATSEP